MKANKEIDNILRHTQNNRPNRSSTYMYENGNTKIDTTAQATLHHKVVNTGKFDDERHIISDIIFHELLTRTDLLRIYLFQELGAYRLIFNAHLFFNNIHQVEIPLLPN